MHPSSFCLWDGSDLSLLQSSSFIQIITKHSHTVALNGIIRTTHTHTQIRRDRWSWFLLGIFFGITNTELSSATLFSPCQTPVNECIFRANKSSLHTVNAFLQDFSITFKSQLLFDLSVSFAASDLIRHQHTTCAEGTYNDTTYMRQSSKTCPWTEAEGMVVKMDVKVLLLDAPEDCSFFTDHTHHQPDRTEQHVTSTLSIHLTQWNCVNLLCQVGSD